MDGDGDHDDDDDDDDDGDKDAFPDSPGSSAENDRLVSPRRQNDDEEASPTKGDGEGTVGKNERTATVSDDPAAVVGRYGRRFSDMRTRMKWAGQGLKKNPSSPSSHSTVQQGSKPGEEATKPAGRWRNNGRFQSKRGRSPAASASPGDVSDGHTAGNDGIASDGEEAAGELSPGGGLPQHHEREGDSDTARYTISMK